MRDRDTDLATTVSADPFREPIRQLGKMLRPTCSIDIDFRETSSGKPLVIAVNPRMGRRRRYAVIELTIWKARIVSF